MPQNEEGGDDESENAEIHLPNDIPWLGHAFPFATANETKLNLRQSLYSSLPDAEKARRLATIYYRHCAWMCVWSCRSSSVIRVNEHETQVHAYPRCRVL